MNITSSSTRIRFAGWICRLDLPAGICRPGFAGRICRPDLPVNLEVVVVVVVLECPLKLFKLIVLVGVMNLVNLKL